MKRKREYIVRLIALLAITPITFTAAGDFFTVFYLDLETDAPGRIPLTTTSQADANVVVNIGLIDQIRSIIDPVPQTDTVDNFGRINQIRQTLDYAPLDFKAMPEANAVNVLGQIRWEIANFTKATNQMERLERQNLQLLANGKQPFDLAVEIPRSIVSCIRAIIVDFSETEPVERLRKLMAGPYKHTPADTIKDGQRLQSGITSVSRDVARAKAGQVLNYAKESGIPLETVLAEAKATARSARSTIEKRGSLDSYMELRVCESMLHLLAENGGLSLLPFIEEMSEADDKNVRYFAVMAHINLAGIDSLDLIRQLDVNGFSGMNRFDIYFRFFQTIRQKKQDEPKGGKWDELCIFLLEKIQDEGSEYIAGLFDRFLLTGLSGYSNSIQRLAVVNRFAESRTPADEHFGKAKEAIEKNPANQRKDFRAKGELLDPERQPR